NRALVPLGYIAGVHGVKGWVKIHSFTRPKEAILSYQPWLLGDDQKPVKIRAGRPQGKTIVVSLPDIENREQAHKQIGLEIAVFRDQMPQPDDNEYYWSDLIGLLVETKDGVGLGRITKMMETGAHDVMVVSDENAESERERLIPFIPGHYVVAVDLEAGKLVADWEADYLT
ncbi:MAG: 16S rRNA processing protein RimM, partial [Rhodothermales bacterium]